jgi:hypothetical protein
LLPVIGLCEIERLKMQKTLNADINTAFSLGIDILYIWSS